ncbi:MAG TPA: zinc ribbon domain-containing protein [Pyrinomonadaceae bacterium]|nr:zinc ribbon domain-containing protein [Pyrinomonadaceae bacterium]
MSTNALLCNSCGAALLPDTSFCRQCGAPVSGDRRAPVSEYSNAPYRGGNENVTTRRLDPRPTSERGAMQFQPPDMPVPLAAAKPTRTKVQPLVLGVALIALFLGILTVVAVVRLRTPTRIVKVVGQGATAQGPLVYPGADTLLDVGGPDGRVMKLRTSDSLDLVQHYYETTLQSTKTVAVSNSVVVIRNDRVTATLLADGDKTNILIKQAP